MVLTDKYGSCSDGNTAGAKAGIRALLSSLDRLSESCSKHNPLQLSH